MAPVSDRKQEGYTEEAIVRTKCTRNAVPAFTLIELLVVIAILAIIMSLLLPALAGARGSGKALKDLANLRSLGQALDIYGSEHEIFPAFRLGAGQTHRASGSPRARWHFAIGEVLGKAPWLPRSEAEQASFLAGNESVRLDNRVFVDPMHTLEDFRALNGEIQSLRNGSYGYNYHYLGNTRAEGPGGREANFPVRVSTVIAPSSTVGFAGSMGNQYRVRERGIREHAYTMDPPRMDTVRHDATTFAQADGKSPPDPRHNGRANTVFVDGHAEPMTLEQLGFRVVDRSSSTLVADDAGDNSLWNGLGYDKDRSAPGP